MGAVIEGVGSRVDEGLGNLARKYRDRIMKECEEAVQLRGETTSYGGCVHEADDMFKVGRFGIWARTLLRPKGSTLVAWTGAGSAREEAAGTAGVDFSCRECAGAHLTRSDCPGGLLHLPSAVLFEVFGRTSARTFWRR